LSRITFLTQVFSCHLQHHSRCLLAVVSLLRPRRRGLTGRVMSPMKRMSLKLRLLYRKKVISPLGLSSTMAVSRLLSPVPKRRQRRSLVVSAAFAKPPDRRSVLFLTPDPPLRLLLRTPFLVETALGSFLWVRKTSLRWTWLASSLHRGTFVALGRPITPSPTHGLMTLQQQPYLN
jgi:hypothetical protein